MLLGKAEKENNEWSNKVKEANESLQQLKSHIAVLKRDIRREILNDEVIGTSKIAELKDSSISVAEKKRLRFVREENFFSKTKN